MPEVLNPQKTEVQQKPTNVILVDQKDPSTLVRKTSKGKILKLLLAGSIASTAATLPACGPTSREMYDCRVNWTDGNGITRTYLVKTVQRTLTNAIGFAKEKFYGYYRDDFLAFNEGSGYQINWVICEPDPTCSCPGGNGGPYRNNGEGGRGSGDECTQLNEWTCEPDSPNEGVGGDYSSTTTDTGDHP